MTFKQPRSTFASFKARWIRTSLSLHLATFDSSSYRLLFHKIIIIIIIIIIIKGSKNVFHQNK